MRTVCGLDIHKDSFFMWILDEQGKKSERKFGVSTREVKSLAMMLKSYFVYCQSIVCIKQKYVKKWGGEILLLIM